MPQLVGLKLPELYVSITLAISPLAYFPLILYINKKHELPLRFPLKIPGIPVLFLIFILALSLRVITSPLSNPVGYFNNLFERKQMILLLNILEFDLNLIIRLIGSVLIVPVFEELFFRKQIFRLLLKGHSPVISIVLSSIFFSLVHLKFDEIGLLFFGGVMFSSVYYFTNSLMTSIMLHSFCNFLAFFTKMEFVDISEGLLLKVILFYIGSIIAVVLILKHMHQKWRDKMQVKMPN
jgi:membrane protease YdiL (CAAX protease family)